VLIGLSALSFSYRCGLIGQGTPRAHRAPLGVDAILDMAAGAGLQSVAFPVELLSDVSPPTLASLRERLARAGLVPVIDSGVADPHALATQIPLAAALGARVVRVLVSPVLEGDRFAFTTDWPTHIHCVIAALRAVRPLAEAHGVTLAVENHQDATSDDLLTIVEGVGGDCVGVTFDATNALIVAEDPFVALERLGPAIRNIHLSDFYAYPTSQGWRLVRCALGAGDLDLRRLLDAVDQYAPHATCQIELVGHNARHIRLFEDSWWQGYPPRDIRDVLPALRRLNQTLRLRDDDWRTPWERGADEATISAYEDQHFNDSVAYLRTIGALPRSASGM
jgi:sugar phosphate isomerase/epimerase